MILLKVHSAIQMVNRRKYLVLLVCCVIDFACSGQNDQRTYTRITFASKEGKRFSSEQIDSLKKIGYYVGISHSKSIFNDSAYSERNTIYFYDKSKYKKQGVYCGNTKRVPLSLIRESFPYNQTATIKLVSFKPDSAHNYLLPRNIEGLIDKSSLFETKSLDKDLANDLIDVLANFKFDTTVTKGIDDMVAFCYEPRNAILFEDKAGRQLGYVELCFECLRNEQEPRTLNIGRFCNEKYEIVKEIFKKGGIRYGVSYVDTKAEYPGGFSEMYKYLASRTKMIEASDKKRGGVFVEFFVDADGTLSDFQILRGLSDEYNDYAVQIIKDMPKWIPAMINENPVKSKTLLPIMFR